jgi:integrase
MSRRRETPLKRTNPSGKTVWVARWTDKTGRRRTGWKDQGIPGTYPMKREAQDAIDACYDLDAGTVSPRQVGTVTAYVDHWTRLHPRSPSTARTYAANLRSALPVRVGGKPLQDWRLDELERSEVAELADHLLRVQGRAANGARSVLQTLSAMFEDAITDGWTRHNPVAGLRIKSTDPRIQKRRRETNVFSWDEMHAMADQAPPQVRAMMRVLSDCGLRLGEMLPLERCDLEDGLVGGSWLWVQRTAVNGSVTAGTKTTRNAPGKARRVPLSPSTLEIVQSLPTRLDTRLLFATERGRVMQNRDFYREWNRAVTAAGFPDAKPHDFRHSYVSLMRAAGVDPADLASWTGHTVTTATATYTHSVGATVELARSVVG